MIWVWEREKNVEKPKIVLREREREIVRVSECVCVCMFERERERKSECVCVCEGYCSFFRSHELAIKSWNYLRPETTGRLFDSNLIQKEVESKMLGHVLDEKYDRKSRRAISSKNNSDKPKHAHHYRTWHF